MDLGTLFLFTLVGQILAGFIPPVPWNELHWRVGHPTPAPVVCTEGHVLAVPAGKCVSLPVQVADRD